LTPIQFQLLADRPDAIPTVARWYFDMWGHKASGNTLDKTIERLKTTLNRNQLPLRVVAIEDRQVIGAATLKLREMDIFPDREHWLGDVFVCPAVRGRGVGSQLVGHLIGRATSLHIHTLHLQTEQLNGGLYAKLGWMPSEEVDYHGARVLIMSRQLSMADAPTEELT